MKFGNNESENMHFWRKFLAHKVNVKSESLFQQLSFCPESVFEICETFSSVIIRAEQLHGGVCVYEM